MSTGKPWVNVVARVLAHLTLVLACVLCVIYICDLKTRGSMMFLDNVMTRSLFAVLCVLAIVSSLMQLKALQRLRAIREYFRLTKKKK